MALSSQSLILYSYQVNDLNASIDFKASSGGPVIMATLRYGYYSLTGLLNEIARAMSVADPANVYIATADRTVAGGTQNRVTIATSGTYLSLLFGSGLRAATAIAPTIGFNASDYTGATSYQGSSTSGKSIISNRIGYNYKPQEINRKVFGAKNVSANGDKEAVVWQVQRFESVEFKDEPKAKVLSDWCDFFTWAMQQRTFDFTPEISNPTKFYEVTLESTATDAQGMGFNMKESLPVANYFETGTMVMRLTTNNG